jgi:hypothetical protein
MKALPPERTYAALLGPMQYCADPLADQAIADIVGPWPAAPAALTGAAGPELLQQHYAKQWQRLATVNQLISQWARNGDLVHWARKADAEAAVSGPGARGTQDIIARLDRFVQDARHLPEWADLHRLERAERLFFEHGALSCVLLFCSSLPECYVVPDISAVLHATGQLEDHTEYRIRSTAAMIFPVMMAGGLTSDSGGGIAQTLKVRLIHATIRHLLLRGNVQAAAALLSTAPPGRTASLAADVPPLRLPLGQYKLPHVLFAHGWKPAADGLPCNQEELAYTLLTFGYVFLRSLHRLGIGLRDADERAFLHAWNVVGHVLGIQRELMADRMTEAEALFAAMQARGRAGRRSPDPRPPLGRTLMQCMENAIPLRVLRPFPVLMTRWLCRSRTMQDLGIAQRQPLVSRLLFLAGMGLARAIDAVMRLVRPQFSISRFIGRVLGYHFMTRVLMNQTRPLQLPQPWLAQVETMMGEWSDDPKAPRWINALEDRLTTAGRWKP